MCKELMKLIENMFLRPSPEEREACRTLLELANVKS